MHQQSQSSYEIKKLRFPTDKGTRSDGFIRKVFPAVVAGGNIHSGIMASDDNITTWCLNKYSMKKSANFYSYGKTWKKTSFKNRKIRVIDGYCGNKAGSVRDKMDKYGL